MWLVTTSKDLDVWLHQCDDFFADICTTARRLAGRLGGWGGADAGGLLSNVQYCDWQRSSGLRVLRQVGICLFCSRHLPSIISLHPPIVIMMWQVLERQKLLETADGMGGLHTANNRQAAADQKVQMVTNWYSGDQSGNGDNMMMVVVRVLKTDVSPPRSN